MRNVFIFFLMLLSVRAHAQTTFQKLYGDAYPVNRAEGYFITSAGDILAAGFRTDQLGLNPKGTLMKTDPAGNVYWSKEYSGIRELTTVMMVADGGFILAGYSDSLSPGDDDVCLLKTDSAGNVQWCKIYGTTDQELYPQSIRQNQQGYYVISGVSNSNLDFSAKPYIFSTDSAGNLLWDKSLMDGFGNASSNFCNTTDGNLVFIATYPTMHIPKLLVMKIDSSGQTMWSKIFGDNIYGTDVEETSDGGFCIAGYSNPANPLDGNLLLKTDASGNFQWSKIYSNGITWPSLIENADGDLVWAGTYQSQGDSASVYFVKTNPQGDTLWTRFYEIPVQAGYRGESAEKVIQVSDDGYVLGCTATDFQHLKKRFIIKTDASGNAGCNLVDRQITIIPFTPTLDTNLTEVSRFVYMGSFNPAVSAVVLNDSILCFHDGISENDHVISMDVYPNPATDVLNINSSATPSQEYLAEILDLTGRIVLHQKIKSGAPSIVEVSTLASGMYVIRLSGKNATGVKLFTVQ